MAVNLKNFTDLYGKALEHDWRARLLPIQILVSSNDHKIPLLTIQARKFAC